jgi:hypothetical protein
LIEKFCPKKFLQNNFRPTDDNTREVLSFFFVEELSHSLLLLLLLLFSSLVIHRRIKECPPLV